MKRIWRQWRIHGLPRCDAYFALDSRMCGRLIWPWQAYNGPESLAHAACREREHMELDKIEL